jgi:hypothetical protein
MNSTINLQTKNPNALAINDKIVKVSVLNQRVRCDGGRGSTGGW